MGRKIGLALGSGSARGWAHIGVIKALNEAGIRLDYVAGTSAGAVVGAVYASGRIDSLKDVVLQLDWKKSSLTGGIRIRLGSSSGGGVESSHSLSKTVSASLKLLKGSPRWISLGL